MRHMEGRKKKTQSLIVCGKQLCPQDIDDYHIHDQKGIQGNKRLYRSFKKAQGNSFLEEAEVGSLLVDIEMKKRGGGKVRDKGAQVSQRTEGCGWAPTHVGAPAELCQ